MDIGCNLNKIDYKPNFIYDTWAITSFCEEFDKKRQLLDEKYLKIPKIKTFRLIKDYFLIIFVIN